MATYIEIDETNYGKYRKIYCSWCSAQKLKSKNFCVNETNCKKVTMRNIISLRQWANLNQKYILNNL